MTDRGPQFLAVAEILKPWGRLGEVKAKILTDFPERITQLSTVNVGPETRAFRLERARLHSGFLILKLEGFDSPELSAKLRGEIVYVPINDAANLSEGQYFHHQIVGLKVLTTDGHNLGTIEEILETGANDVYVVRRETGDEVLLPAIHDVVKEIDIERGQMIVEPTSGLI